MNPANDNNNASSSQQPRRGQPPRRRFAGLLTSLRATLEHAGKSIEDVDALVLHQANIRIIDSVIDELGINPTKALVNVDQYGNTSAGSIPLALAEAHARDRIHRGDLVLMCGFGAGLTWGSALLRW